MLICLVTDIQSLVLAMYYNYFGPTFWYMAITNGYAGWGDKVSGSILYTNRLPQVLKSIVSEGHVRNCPTRTRRILPLHSAGSPDSLH